jgi:single-stranded-DNA-specific exonuclease
METLTTLERLGPFGAQNEAPRFKLEDCRLVSVDAVGNGAHLKLALQAGKQFCKAISWRRGEAAETLRVGQHLDVVGSLEANTWNGKTSLQLVVEDFDDSAQRGKAAVEDGALAVGD